jgi:hypothetical protein
MQRVLVLDLTKAWLNSELGLIGQARLRFAGDSILAIHTLGESRARYVGTEPNVTFHEVTRETSDATSAFSAVLNLAAQVARDAANQLPEVDAISIVSHHPAFVEVRKLLSPILNRKTELLHWKSFQPLYLPTGASAGARSTLPVEWPEALMPMDEAVEILVASLLRSGATRAERAIRLSDLRGILASQDPRLRKDNPLASHSRIPSLILTAALRSNRVVARSYQPDGNPRVWIESAHVAAFVSPPSTGEGSNSAPVEHGAEAPPRDRAAAVSTRSQGFLDELRRKDAGPFSAIRQELFDELRRTVDAAPEEGIALSDLLFSAIEDTKATHASATYPWRHVHAFLVKLLSESAVLLDAEGVAFRASVAVGSKHVFGLAPGWKDELDSRILIELLEAGVAVTLADIPDLAGALYQSRSREAQARAVRILDRVLISRGVVVSGEGSSAALTLPKQV